MVQGGVQPGRIVLKESVPVRAKAVSVSAAAIRAIDLRMLTEDTISEGLGDLPVASLCMGIEINHNR